MHFQFIQGKLTIKRWLLESEGNDFYISGLKYCSDSIRAVCGSNGTYLTQKQIGQKGNGGGGAC